MAADVSSNLNSRRDEQKKLMNEPAVLITRDLLGSCSKAASCSSSSDLDLNLHASSSWEKRLDLKLGKAQAQRPQSWSEEMGREPAVRDMNAPPLNPLEESCLELKLFPFIQNQSVCTLDKVKSALERAEKETSKKRSSPPISLTSSLTTREEEEEDEEEKRSSLSLPESPASPAASSVMFAAGCPVCLLYVMTYKKNPKCPRCDSIVPSPSAFKKPRIDLNASA